ncbi:MFS transporter [Streptomyces albiaxialis]|uniref:MFS transporter n=1 Tax=Streptomyces albiaxialis TaxID=329523 RepID=A0ABN2VUG3_9ACTN
MSGREGGGPGSVLALACTGSFVVVMDATIVSVALPDIRTGLGFGPSGLAWVVNAYTLAFAGFLLLGGRLADVFGQRRMFAVGMGVFTVARLAAGLAATDGQLLAARAVQGLGGALLMPVTLSLVTTAFPEPAGRARALGTWSAVGAVGASSGPVLGGLLTEWAGWRWVFFVTVPVGAAAVAAAVRVLPPRVLPARAPSARAPERGGRTRPRLDVTGAVTATAGLVAVVHGVMRAPDTGWAGAPFLGSVGGGALLLVLFAVHQGRWAREPLVPLGLFRLRAVSGGNAVMFLLGLGFFASPVLLSLYLQDVHGYAPLDAGLAYLPVGAAMFAGATAASRVSLRLGPRRAAVAACLLGAAGYGAMAALAGTDASYAVSVMLPGAVFGLGTAAAFTPITVSATSGVPAHQNGLAAGVLNTVRQTSGAVGLAALSTLSAAVTTAADGDASSDASSTGGTSMATASRAALAEGYAAAFGASACLLGVAALVAWVAMPRERGPEAATERPFPRLTVARRERRLVPGSRDSPRGSSRGGRRGGA